MNCFSGYLLIAATMALPLTAAADELGRARIGLIEGDVQVMIPDTTDWTPAALNLPLNEGDRLWSPEASRAEIQLRGGVHVRVDGDTALDLLTLAPDSAQFYVDRGRVYINNRTGGIKTVQVDTPGSSIRGYDNSIMMVDLAEDGISEISVLKGIAYVESKSGAVQVTAGNTLTLRGPDGADLAPLSQPEDWERWNGDRDRKLLSWGESSRYLPDELHEYSSDFDEHGRWEYESEFGWIWTPAGVAVDWAPYSAGHWTWLRGSYVWISLDPWGWAPFHYGRWIHRGHIGWCWIPPVRGAVYWSPGYVGWIVTPAYVAWVPLAPSEIYYGYGFYGPWSINITTINIHTTVVHRRYVNAAHRHGVIAERRESFGTGRRTPVQLRENPFADEQAHRRANTALVPPRERPQHPVTFMQRERRETRQGVRPPLVQERATTQRQAPSAGAPQPAHRLPPDRVRQTRPQELKNERPLVRDRGASVLRQQPENMQVRKQREPKTIIRKQTEQERGPQGDRRERRRER